MLPGKRKTLKPGRSPMRDTRAGSQRDLSSETRADSGNGLEERARRSSLSGDRPVRVPLAIEGQNIEIPARAVMNKILSVVSKKRYTEDSAEASMMKKQRCVDSGTDAPREGELTSSDARSTADHPRPSSGDTITDEGSHDPTSAFGRKSQVSHTSVLNQLDSVYQDSELRDRLICEQSDIKRYVKTVNRRQERMAMSILKRRASQGDIVANLLVENNINTDLLARYQSCQYEPVSHEEAMSTEDRDKWMEAERAEIRSLIKNKVFAVVDRPSNRKPIPCKWIYKRKKSKAGTVEKFKARLVAKGFHQIYSQDFN